MIEIYFFKFLVSYNCQTILFSIYVIENSYEKSDSIFQLV